MKQKKVKVTYNLERMEQCCTKESESFPFPTDDMMMRVRMHVHPQLTESHACALNNLPASIQLIRSVLQGRNKTPRVESPSSSPKPLFVVVDVVGMKASFSISFIFGKNYVNFD
jgi:hypothetical protein